MKLYEYTCGPCGFDFDSISPLCPRCSKEAKRAYRTPPGYITRGLVRKIDTVLGHELADRGLSDIPRPRDFSDIEPRAAFPMSTGSTASGRDQQPITPTWGKPGLAKINETYGTNFVPPSTSGPSYPVSGEDNSVGPPRDYIRKHTQVVARIDANGDRIG